MSTTITSVIDVDVPVRTAYEQWTQFETFPEYLSGVKEVKQLDDVMTHWVVNVGGVEREFDARIVDQVPDDHVAWRSVSDVSHEGRVAFRPDGDGGTQVELSMAWEPESFAEKVGAALQLDDLIVKRDLQRFKDFIESRHAPTGAWRGEVHGGTTQPDAGVGTSAAAGAPGTTGSGSFSAAETSTLSGDGSTSAAEHLSDPQTGEARGEDPDLRV